MCYHSKPEISSRKWTEYQGFATDIRWSKQLQILNERYEYMNTDMPISAYFVIDPFTIAEVEERCYD